MKRPTPPPDQVRSLVARCLELFERRGARAVDGFLERHTDASAQVRERLDLLGSLGLVGEPPEQSVPERIGAYRILSVLGRGGMGVVYEARQLRPNRTVALKVLRSWPGEHARARFEHEAELLARLQHPGIAAIHEVGTATVGGMTVPFFAMELIRGRPLDVFAREESLDLRARVALLAQVADAVHHAHQKGVVHRDLKPGNVLVDERGEPRVLDFGIARALDPDLELETMRTRTGELLGTLPYMSPEQAAGRSAEIDSRSDVYSLGALAFELLTGRLPVETAGSSVLEALRALRDDEPPRLGSLDRALRGDLETIVAVALAKERERRYASAHELAADLRRFLEHEPISARPATASYQLVKYARRNRALVGGALAVLAALLVGLGGTLFGLARATENRDEAERLFRQSETLLEFQERMFQSADPSGKGIRVGDLLDRSVLLVDGFTADPVEEAAIRLALGKAYRGIGRFEAAEELASRAVEVLDRELGPDELKPLFARIEWASLLGHQMGRYREAERVLAGVAERAGRLFGPTHEASLSARLVEVELDYDLGRSAAALAGAEEVERLAEPGGASWMSARRWHANLLAERGEVDAAIDLAREQLEWNLARFGRHHPSTWNAMESLGSMLLHNGHTVDAMPILEELLEVRAQSLGDEHPQTIDARIRVASAQIYLGAYDRAEELLLQALEAGDKFLGPNHPTRLSALNALAAAYDSQGRIAEAEARFREVVERTSAVRGPEHRNTLAAMLNLAVELGKLGRAEEAEELYREVLAIQLRTLGEGHADTLTTRLQFGAFLRYHGRLQESEELLGAAVDSARKSLGPEHDLMALLLWSLGETLTYQGRFEEAESLLLECREATDRSYPEDHPQQLEILRSLAFLYQRWGKPEAAQRYTKLLGERSP